jgi:hypothetical protein
MNCYGRLSSQKKEEHLKKLRIAREQKRNADVNLGSNLLILNLCHILFLLLQFTEHGHCKWSGEHTTLKKGQAEEMMKIEMEADYRSKPCR